MDDKDKSKDMLKNLLSIALILLIIAITVIAIYFIYQSNKDKNSEENKLSYTQLIKEIDLGNVEKIDMTVGSKIKRC